jgi:hypothetical protein
LDDGFWVLGGRRIFCLFEVGFGSDFELTGFLCVVGSN